MLTSNVGQKRLTRSVNLSFEQTQKNGNMCKMKVDDCCGFFDPVSHGFPPRQGKAGSSCKAK